MPYAASVKFLLPFSGNSLLEAISGSELFIGGERETPVFDDSYGYKMQDNQYIYIKNRSFGLTTDFTVAFRLHPNNPGMVRNPTTGEIESVKFPILALATGTVSGDDYVPGSPVIQVHEESLPNNQNQLVVKVRGFVTRTVVSYPYDCDIDHHIAIVFNNTTVGIYVDASLYNYQSFGSKPSSITTSNVGLWVGYPFLGDFYYTARNTGYIDDLFILNTGSYGISEATQHINNGVEFMTDSLLAGTEENDFTFVFDDPAILKVTDFFNDGTYLYASMSDGRVLQGSRSMWQSRKDFSDQNEASVLKKFGSGVTVENGYLKITDGMVRF